MSEGAPSLWEWRTFAPELDPLAIRLPESFETLDETFIVCPESDTRTAIRGAAVEVDRLDDCRDGLQLWRRAMSVTFPLCQHDVRDVLREFPVAPPALYRPEYSAFQFVTEVATCTNGLRVVGMRTIDRRVAIDGCTLERGTISIAGATWQSVAVTGSDRELVRRLIARFGFDRFENVGVVALVKRVLGLPRAGRIPKTLGDFSHAF